MIVLAATLALGPAALAVHLVVRRARRQRALARMGKSLAEFLERGDA